MIAAAAHCTEIIATETVTRPLAMAPRAREGRWPREISAGLCAALELRSVVVTLRRVAEDRASSCLISQVSPIDPGRLPASALKGRDSRSVSGIGRRPALQAPRLLTVQVEPDQPDQVPPPHGGEQAG